MIQEILSFEETAFVIYVTLDFHELDYFDIITDALGNLYACFQDRI